MVSPSIEVGTRGGERNLGADTKETSRTRSKFCRAIAIGPVILVAVIVTLCCTLLLPSSGSQHPGQPTPGGASPGGSGQLLDVVIMQPSTPPPTQPVQLYYLPHYNIHVVMHGPSSARGGFTPLYDPVPSGRFCTVVAGTDILGVTGGGTNGEMADHLAWHSKGQYSRKEVEESTRMAQIAALEQAKEQPGVLCEHRSTSCPFFKNMFSLYVPHAAKNVESTVAIPILAVLKDEYHIHGHPHNDCFVYVVSPKGNVPDPDFAEAYAATYSNVLTLVQRHNDLVREHEKIKAVRFPLLSGGIYRGGRATEGLGYTAAKAMLQWMATNRADFTIDLGYDDNNSFFTGMRRAASE